MGTSTFSRNVRTTNGKVLQMNLSAFQGLDKIQTATLHRIAKKRPEQVEKINKMVEVIKGYDAVVMDWLAADQSHVQAFFESPIEAFREATGASDKQMEELREYASIYQADKQPVNPVQLSTAPIFSDSACVDTQGWDVVSAICQREANKGLNCAYKAGLLPVIFHKEMVKEIFGIQFTIKTSGSFEAPQITGGSGNYIDILLNIKEVNIGINEEQPVLIENISLKLTTNLTCIETYRKDQDATHCEFYINFTDSNVFSNICIEGLPSEMDENKFLIEEALLEALNEAATGKEYKLFEADLNLKAEAPYLVPQYVCYAFVESGTNPDDNIIGALVQTNSPQKGVRQLMANTIPSQSRAALVLSNNLFMNGILRDLIVESVGCSSDNLVVTGNPGTLHTVSSFEYKEKVEGYTLMVEELKLGISDDLLHMDIKAEVEPSKGLLVTYDIHSSLKPVIKDDTKDGKCVQYISFEENSYEENHKVSADWWVWLLGALTLGIGDVIVGIILGIIKGITPDVGCVAITTAIGSVQWNYADVLKIKEIHLDGTVQIGCDVLPGK